MYYDNFSDIKIEPLTYETKNGCLIVKHNHPLSKNTEFVIDL
jgi:hypothetical protein